MSLAIRHLSKEFQGVSALRAIDLEIAQGEIFGIIGHSGAGKSTLVRCIAGLEKPTSGSVDLQGGQLGMIFQHFNLFSSRTALQNVLFPMEVAGKVDHSLARRLLSLVGLENFADSYPAQLSGGQKQRVAIARALACDPALLLCDEPTSALDPTATAAILNLLADLNRRLGLTIVLITHDMEVIKQACTHVAVLDAGEIVEQGRVEEVFSNPQHPTTVKLLQSLTHTPPEGEHLYRLSFKGETAQKPVISELIKTHDVQINILLGGIDALKTMTVGTLVVQLLGTDAAIADALDFLKSQGVGCDALSR